MRILYGLVAVVVIAAPVHADSGPYPVPQLAAQAALFAHSDPLIAYADSTPRVRVARFDVEVTGGLR